MSSEDTPERRIAESQTNKADTVQVQGEEVVTSGPPNGDASETQSGGNVEPEFEPESKPDKKNPYKLFNAICWISGVIFLVCMITDIVLSGFNSGVKEVAYVISYVKIGVIIVGLIAAIPFGFGLVGICITKLEDEEEKATAQRFKEDLEKSLSDKDEHYNYLGHLKLNWDKLQGYYDISKKQANSSFVWAIVCFFVGIAIIASTVVVPVWVAFSSTDGFKNYDSVIAIVGAVSGAITEFFAVTIMLVYKKSLEQLNFYHDALAHYQTYLSCVNLAGLMSGDKRDKIFEKIIDKEFEYAMKSLAVKSKDGKSEKEESKENGSENNKSKEGKPKNDIPKEKEPKKTEDGDSECEDE